MFESLAEKLSSAFRHLRGVGRLSAENIQTMLSEIRSSLLEADVALPVIENILLSLKQQVIGQAVHKSLTPGQAFLKQVHRTLLDIMGPPVALNLATQPPAVILLAGLQGAGKTTCAAKLGYLLKKKSRKRVLLVSTDVYRPAAVEQLELLGAQHELTTMPQGEHTSPLHIANAALAHARIKLYDVLIVDTAGRLHIDQALMRELVELQQALNPIETLFVMDAMMGQDALKTTKAFHAALSITGIMLTKIDSDTRGGAALSVRHETGKPIKFLGIGEKIEDFIPFDPQRIVSQMLGMGDMLSLIETIEEKSDPHALKGLEKKFKRGERFDLNDFLSQMKQLQAIGGLQTLMKKLPYFGGVRPSISPGNEQQIPKMIAIIHSMTPYERAHPEILKASRKRRIAAGSGVQITEVNRLLKQFENMQTMMKRFKPGKLKQLASQAQQFMKIPFKR